MCMRDTYCACVNIRQLFPSPEHQMLMVPTLFSCNQYPGEKGQLEDIWNCLWRRERKDVLWCWIRILCIYMFPSCEHTSGQVWARLAFFSLAINKWTAGATIPPLTSLSSTLRWCCWGQIYKFPLLATKTSDKSKNQYAVDYTHKFLNLIR